MKTDEILAELERAAAGLGVQVSYEALAGEGVGAGGLCKVRGQWRVLVDRRATAGEKVGVLAQALAGFDLEGLYLAPQTREVVRAAADRAEARARLSGTSATQAGPVPAAGAPASDDVDGTG